MSAANETFSVEMAAPFDFRSIVCGACGSDRANLLGWRGGDAHHGGSGIRTRIVRCRDCSHIYPNPMPFPAGSLQDLYTDTDDYFHGHDVEAKKQSALEKMAYFEKTLGHRGRYLDVACGRGESLWAGRESGWEYEGVDASPTYLKWATENLGVRGRLGTLDEIKFEVFRILKPGGLLWFDAPNETGLYMLVGNLYMKCLGRDWCINLAPTFPPYHVQGFTPASLRTLLVRVGFDILRHRIEGGVWPFTGEPSFRKRLEYGAARIVTWLGNKTGRGSYMEALVRKPQS
jgi:SAM-dependent methyltransferase